jgi:nitrate/nitrite-specific signal transduction histidine kinase
VQGYDFKQIAKDVRERAAANGDDLYLGTFYDPTSARDDSRNQDQDFYKKLQALYSEEEKTTDPSVKAEKQKEAEALWSQHLDPLKQESRRQLRMQVKDFIGWLKGQGVI